MTTSFPSRETMHAAPLTSAPSRSRCLAVFGTHHADGPLPAVEVGELSGVPIHVGLHLRRDPVFSPSAPTHRRSVLVRVLAFSLNYRDRSFLAFMAYRAARAFLPVGSEFCGVVEAIGDEVTSLQVGDRVFGDNAYSGPGASALGEGAGVVTNAASCERMIIQASRLMRVPTNMSDAEAACFSLNAQTAYSMVRKSGVGAGDTVLVTAASSGASLFAIGALGARGADVVALTSRSSIVDRLRNAGASSVIVQPKGEHLDRLERSLQGAAPFAAVIDPFFDLHVPLAPRILRPFGRYLTCGVAEQQLEREGGVRSAPIDGTTLLLQSILHNTTIIGNCLGTTDDLRDACADFESGRLRVVVDSVHTGTPVLPFVLRTYASADRFGKVAYVYGD